MEGTCPRWHHGGASSKHQHKWVRTYHTKFGELMKKFHGLAHPMNQLKVNSGYATCDKTNTSIIPPAPLSRLMVCSDAKAVPGEVAVCRQWPAATAWLVHPGFLDLSTQSGAEKNDPTFPAGPPDVDSGAHAAAADQRPPGGITCEGNSKAAP